ncbi:tyrosine-type recombinase/integrase [Microvirga brassicacearum]|nr:tyrosine-type recombinase/integrase [Microvirga brassicacearum]
MAKEAGPRTREISIEEEDAIRALPTFREGYGPCFSFAIISGLRLDNFVNLKWSQIDLANREIKVIQKGGREHRVPIDDELMKILLKEKGKDDEFVFTYVTQNTYFNKMAKRQCIRNERRRIAREGFTSWFDHIRKRLRLDIRIHDLRRTAGARLLRATGNLKAVQQLLGHANIATTAKHYSHIPLPDLIALQDRTHADIKRRRAEMAFLFQEHAAFPRVTPESLIDR